MATRGEQFRADVERATHHQEKQPGKNPKPRTGEVAGSDPKDSPQLDRVSRQRPVTPKARHERR